MTNSLLYATIMILSSAKLFINNLPNILLYFAISIALMILHLFFPYQSIVYISATYISLTHLALLIMSGNSLINNDGKRTKFTGLFYYIKLNYKKILKILIMYFFLSFVVDFTKAIIKVLLTYYYQMHDKSRLSALLDASFSHFLALILSAIVLSCLSDNNSSLIKVFKLIKKNIVSFILMLSATLLIPYLLAIIIIIIIKTSGITRAEFAQLFVPLITSLSWLIIEGKTTAGVFFSSLGVLIIHLKLICSVPFYIFWMNIAHKTQRNSILNHSKTQ